jgi:hypothetical protein
MWCVSNFRRSSLKPETVLVPLSPFCLERCLVLKSMLMMYSVVHTLPSHRPAFFTPLVSQIRTTHFTSHTRPRAVNFSLAFPFPEFDLPLRETLRPANESDRNRTNTPTTLHTTIAAETVHTWLLIFITMKIKRRRIVNQRLAVTGLYSYRHCLGKAIKALLYAFHLANTYRYRTHSCLGSPHSNPPAPNT